MYIVLQILYPFSQGHHRAVYPMLFIPGTDTGTTDEDGLHINPGDTLITGSTDTTARSWSLDMDICLKVEIVRPLC